MTDVTLHTLVVEPLEDLAEITAACALVDGVWRTRDLIPPTLVRAIQHAGGYVVGARLDGDLVGASIAFRGNARHGGRSVATLHSHVTATTAPGCGVGTALKQHQRAWCAGQGIAAITWTFDPLVARNARFNLRTLGAVVEEYLADHYGPMPDGVNAGDASDRLLAWWPVADTAPSPSGPAILPLLDRVGGRPVASALRDLRGADAMTVALPEDVEALRTSDRQTAAAWRLAVRDALGTALATGWRATSATDDARIVLTRRPS